jgi:type II secretory pathway pseudopilin PulG
LLEILISLSLLSILLTFLFTSMARSAHVETKIDLARKELLERQRLQTRLQDLFITAENGSLYTKKLPGDKIESLIAVFDNGIDPDPSFSGKVVARIYLDEHRNLSLALWPQDSSKKKNRPWRNEILLTGVDSYEFLSLRKTEEKFAWESLSPMNSKENPSMIRMNAQQNQTLLSYAFFFSSQEPLVTYLEGSAR